MLICDMIGQTFNHLLIISKASKKDNDRSIRLNCLCKCSKKTIHRKSEILSNHTKSCGCLRKPHGHTSRKGLKRTPTYVSWECMFQRCYNRNNESYCFYGGRDIQICDRWHNFSNFLKDMGLRPSNKHTIDRKNNNGNYTPENCRWALPILQANNTSRNHYITISGKTYTLTQWVRIFNSNYDKVRSRLRRGWSPEKALSS